MKKKFSAWVRVLAFGVGMVFIFLGGVDFLISTIPGIGLVIWSITGEFKEF